MKTMKLQLSLGGMTNLNSSVTDLNAKLSRADSVFSRLTTTIAALNRQLDKLSTTGLPLVPKPSGGWSGGGGGGGSNNSSPTKFMHPDSLIFSAVTGQTNVLGAKVVSGFSRLSSSALGVSATFAGIIGAGYLVKQAFETIGEYAKEAFTVGTYYGNHGMVPTATINGIAGGLGLPPEDVANYVNSRPDYGAMLPKQLEWLRGIENDFARQRAAESAGIPLEYTNVRKLTDKQFSDMLKGFERPIANGVSGASEYSTNTAKLGALWENVKLDLMERFNSFFDTELSGANIMRGINTMLAPLGTAHKLRGVTDSRIGGKDLPKVGDKLDKASGKLSDSADQIAEAAMSLFKVAKTTYFGGGDRARHAIPSGWLYYGNHLWMKDYAQNLGALKL